MSDLYLELRSRIPVVAAQTQIGTARLQEAQDAVGLSNESIARLIPISEKTWRRWKADGAVPTYALPAVARALRLELIEPQRPLLTEDPAAGGSVEDHLEALAAAVAQVLATQEEILDLLRGDAARARKPQRARAKPR